MKFLIASAFISLFTLSTYATEAGFRNPEFAASAKSAARAIYNVNWGSAKDLRFEIIKEKIKKDELHTSAKYKVRVLEVESGKKYDRGIDFDVEVFEGAVLKVTVDCRTCS